MPLLGGTIHSYSPSHYSDCIYRCLGPEIFPFTAFEKVCCRWKKGGIIYAQPFMRSLS